jgi:hypothetical protein
VSLSFAQVGKDKGKAKKDSCPPVSNYDHHLEHYCMVACLIQIQS